MDNREKFGSRLGFILISAGCAIGLGNVWRFPYITGQYGGAAFVILYLFFLIVMGLPIMSMEFATGRASQKGIAGSFNALEPEGSKWHIFKWFALAGNVLLMMFYTVVAGWFLNYTIKMAAGNFTHLTEGYTAEVFVGMLGNAGELFVWAAVVIVLAIVICSVGVRNGVERITKIMMLGLLALIIILVVRSVTLDGAAEGLAFYLAPDFSKIFASTDTFGEAAYAAMGQSFFTLSLGIGSMAIFGSYINKERSLFNESVTIGILDTFVALMAGFIIFPACFAFGVDPGAGAGLVFITLPNVFEQMPLGQLWGTLFFLFMAFAALSTVIAVLENIVAFGMDQWGWSRKKSSWVTLIAMLILILPAIFGMNPALGDSYLPIGGTVDGLEDFIVSNNLLPLGSLIFLLFCVSKKGWGWKNFLEECNTGEGLKFPRWLYNWMRFGVPILIAVIFIMGWIPTITKLMGA